MLEQNKEIYKHLRNLSKSLNDLSTSLCMKYRRLRVLVYLELWFVILIVIFLFFMQEIIIRVNSFLVFSIYIITLFLMVSIYSKLRVIEQDFKSTYNDGLMVLRTMVDETEWTIYRRRLIYKGNIDNVLFSIDKFSYMYNRIWSPCRKDYNYYRYIVLFIPMVIISSIIITTIRMVFEI